MDLATVMLCGFSSKGLPGLTAKAGNRSDLVEEPLCFRPRDLECCDRRLELYDRRKRSWSLRTFLLLCTSGSLVFFKYSVSDPSHAKPVEHRIVDHLAQRRLSHRLVVLDLVDVQ